MENWDIITQYKLFWHYNNFFFFRGGVGGGALMPLHAPWGFSPYVFNTIYFIMFVYHWDTFWLSLERIDCYGDELWRRKLRFLSNAVSMR